MNLNEGKMMRRIILFLFLISIAISDLYGRHCNHSTGRTQNNLMPNVMFGVIPRPLGETSAVAFFAEAGRRNYRANGTAGMIWGQFDRLKISGEYLAQKLGYHYSTGRENRWVHQYAAGMEYQHDFCNDYLAGADLGVTYSYAPNRNLGHKTCRDFIFYNRIAGSSSYGLSAGVTITPWSCGYFQVDADYDSVLYRRRFRPRKRVAGFGGTVAFHQGLVYNLFLDLLAEFKRPYNYQRASLSWYAPEWSGFTIGLYGSHMRGKYHLPSNTSAGVELSYIFGDMIGLPNECTPCYCGPELSSWVGNPAVYIPQVLAIAEEKRVRRPVPPPPPPPPPVCQTLISFPIQDATFSGVGNYNLNVSSAFVNPSGQPLVFSASGLPAGSTIDPVTGVISGPILSENQSYVVTVTANSTDACEAVSRTFTITFVCVAPTSTTIPNQNITLLVGDPYSLDVVQVHFTSPGGQPFVFTATGLPGGSSIDPVTGIISGTVPEGGPFSVTVTGTTACGSTIQTFSLSFQSA